MSDIIYSDTACGLLEHLGNQSGNPNLCGPKNICMTLGLDDQQYLRAKGKKGGTGWPYKVTRRTNVEESQGSYDFVKRLTEALGLVAEGYDNPRRFMLLADEWLQSRGISIPQLSAIRGETPDAWQTRFPQDDEYFKRFCNCIIERCHRECSAKAASTITSEQQLQAKVDTTPQIKSVAWLAFAVVSDEPCLIEVGRHLQMSWAEDGLGPVEGVRADSFRELFESVLPHGLCGALCASTGNEHPAASLCDPIYLQLCRDEIVMWFTRDNGHQFVKMVTNCRALLAPATDGTLLMRRCTRLFAQLAEISRDPQAVRTSLGCVRQYARGDAARVLALVALALLIGPERHQILRSVTQRR